MTLSPEMMTQLGLGVTQLVGLFAAVRVLQADLANLRRRFDTHEEQACARDVLLREHGERIARLEARASAAERGP